MTLAKRCTCSACSKKPGSAERCLSIHPPESLSICKCRCGGHPRSKRSEIVGWVVDALKIGAAVISIAVAFWKT